MVHCVECEMLNDYPCVRYGSCPNDDDFYEVVQNYFKNDEK